MSLTGSLTDFSLLEIFQFIENGHKTGLLTLRSLPESQASSPSVHYMWMSQGELVATAHQLNHQGLISLIVQYQWISDRVITKLAQFSPANQPLGLYLRKQGALQVKQLEHLFQIQVAQELCALSQLEDAWFKFDQTVSLPMREMTGLSLPTETLKGMWEQLTWLDKLFEARKRQQQGCEGINHEYEPFCHQLITILDIAFFHSLRFSLFDTNYSLERLSHVLDWYDRPYDLPQSRKEAVMCCTAH